MQTRAGAGRLTSMATYGDANRIQAQDLNNDYQDSLLQPIGSGSYPALNESNLSRSVPLSSRLGREKS